MDRTWDVATLESLGTSVVDDLYTLVLNCLLDLLKAKNFFSVESVCKVCLFSGF